jgi:hypothetical protein
VLSAWQRARRGCGVRAIEGRPCRGGCCPAQARARPPGRCLSWQARLEALQGRCGPRQAAVRAHSRSAHGLPAPPPPLPPRLSLPPRPPPRRAAMLRSPRCVWASTAPVLQGGRQGSRPPAHARAPRRACRCGRGGPWQQTRASRQPPAQRCRMLHEGMPRVMAHDQRAASEWRAHRVSAAIWLRHGQQQQQQLQPSACVGAARRASRPASGADAPLPPSAPSRPKRASRSR